MRRLDQWLAVLFFSLAVAVIIGFVYTDLERTCLEAGGRMSGVQCRLP
jgi:hypothetical protein